MFCSLNCQLNGSIVKPFVQKAFSYPKCISKQRKEKNMKRFTVLLMVLCMVSISQAEMLADFEDGGLDGFSAVGTPASTLSNDTTTTAGITSGTHCLKIVNGGVNFWPLRWTAPAMPTRLRKLQMDVTFIAAEWGGQWARFHQKLNFGFGPIGPGYTETPDTTTANWKFRDSTAVCPVDWGSWLGDEKATFTVDLSNYNTNLANAVAAGNTQFWIGMTFNSTGVCPYYIDNMHWVDEPYNPAPANNGIGFVGATTQVAWTNAIPALEYAQVWFGEITVPTSDPNYPSTGNYKSKLSMISKIANPGATSTATIPAIVDGKKYAWIVEGFKGCGDPNNSTEPNYPGVVWTFTGTTNNPPVANAGPDQYIYSYTDVNDIVITLDGSASTDDGKVSSLAYTWTQVGTDPTPAVINSPNAKITTVNLHGGLANTINDGTNPAAPYVFHLVANDGQFTGTEDDVTVYVLSDSCRASIQYPGGFYFYGDIAGAAGAGGNFRDCKVDLYDFAEMALNWLGCSNTFAACP
jgi:hypothetical protein